MEAIFDQIAHLFICVHIKRKQVIWKKKEEQLSKR